MEGNHTNPVKIIALSVFALVALYVLSIGPVVRFSNSPSPLLMRIYAPLIWLDNTFPTISYAITWYAELWERNSN